MKSKLCQFAVMLVVAVIFSTAAPVEGSGGMVHGSVLYGAGSPGEEDYLGYVVQEGDNLSLIAEKFQIPLAQLFKANNLRSCLIRPGDVLLISGRPETETVSRGSISREDLLLLARMIYAEARGESFEGQVAVGAVILNRLYSGDFPGSIREIIMQRTGNVYQFSPVGDGSINLEPNEAAINAAIHALMGNDPTGGALFFYNPKTATDGWIKTLPVITRIGNHVFATRA